MKISYNWLKQYLDFDLSPEEASVALTSLGLEVEGVEHIESITGGLAGLVIGEVLTCQQVEGADKLNLTTVNIGQAENLQIVCGAPNIATKQKVVVATVGTTLYPDGKALEIGARKVFGVESAGMICSATEIGVGTDSSGIIVLPSNAKVGSLAKDYYNVTSDYLIEIDITPNRSDALSHYGVARDLAAYLKQNGKAFNLNKPSVDSFKIDEENGTIKVNIENTEACPRYTGLSIKGVEIKESPQWLQNYLNIIGLRPINNVVDITNYVLHEFGHPLHAFDAKYIPSGEISIKTLANGSKFVTLDEQELELTDKDLMICHQDEGLCIAGVFGGLKSGVTESTKDVFLECAYFHPTWVRKTARRHGLNTDSSFRFERGSNPNNNLYIIKRAALLIQELAGGKIIGEIQDVYPNPIQNIELELLYDRVTKVIGKELEKKTVSSILSSLEFEILEEKEDSWKISIPHYRADVNRDVDVIEEILRVYGYNNIELSNNLHSSLSYQTDTDRNYSLENIVSEQLTGSSFNEIMCNSLTKEAYYKESEVYPISNCVHLINPLSSDLNVMRQTLLYGGLESLAYNRNRKNSNIKFYEFGNCYFYDKTKKEESKNLNEYSEEYHLGLWFSGNTAKHNWAVADKESSVYELKSYVENILARVGLPLSRLMYYQYSDELYAAALKINIKGAKGQALGVIGIVSKAVLKKTDIDADVFYAELNWDMLMELTANNKLTATEIPKYPAVKRDLALLIDKKVRFEEIEWTARKAERELLKDITLFDVYEGKNLAEGKKSYAVNFIIQDKKKTLADKDIDRVMYKIQKALEEELGAQLR